MLAQAASTKAGAAQISFIIRNTPRGPLWPPSATASIRRPVATPARRGLDRPMIGILYSIIHAVIGLYIVVLIVHVVISWLFAFDVVSRRNEFVNAIWRFTTALTDPVLRPLRRLIPPIAGVDLSVLVLVLGLAIFRDSILPWLVNLIRGGPIL